MLTKKTLEEEINSFLEIWNVDQITSFFEDVFPLLELYNVDENDDWVKDIVGEDDLQNVRLIRTVYLISRIAENHSGKLAKTKANFKNIWKRLEENE